MNRDEVIATLQAHQQELRQRGVLHAAVFGSVARREERPDSDIDILIELEPDQSLDVFAYVGLKRFIGGLFPSSVDVINEAALKQGLRDPVRRDAAYAFSKDSQQPLTADLTPACFSLAHLSDVLYALIVQTYSLISTKLPCPLLLKFLNSSVANRSSMIL